MRWRSTGDTFPPARNFSGTNTRAQAHCWVLTHGCAACSGVGENSLDSLNCCHLSPHHGPSDLQQGTGWGAVPERRQDYSSNHGTSPFGSDQPGTTQLRVSESVALSGFLNAGLGGGGRQGEGLWSLGQAASYTASCAKSFLLKQRTRIAKQHQAPIKHFSRMFV